MNFGARVLYSIDELAKKGIVHSEQGAIEVTESRALLLLLCHYAVCSTIEEAGVGCFWVLLYTLRIIESGIQPRHPMLEFRQYAGGVLLRIIGSAASGQLRALHSAS